MAGEALVETTFMPDPIVIANDILKMEVALRNREIPMHLALEEVIINIYDHFEDGGDGDWAPLKESYARTKSNRAYKLGRASGADNILVLTGALKSSVLESSNYAVTNSSISWTGATAPFYGGIHLTGADHGDYAMPARVFPYLNEVGADAITTVFWEWLNEVGDLFTGGGSVALGGTTGIRPGFSQVGPNLFRGPGGKFASRGSAMF